MTSVPSMGSCAMARAAHLCAALHDKACCGVVQAAAERT